MKLSAPKLCDALRIDRKTLTNWLNEAEPVPGVKSGGVWSFVLADVVAWREARAARQAVARVERDRPTDADAERARLTRAQADKAEMERDELRGHLIRTETHRKEFEAMGARLRAVLLNLPSNHALHLERLGVDAGRAQDVLERIADELTRALRDAASDEEAGDDALAA